MTNESNEGTDLVHVSGLQGTISDVADKYEYVIMNGVRFWLARMGFIPGDPRTAKTILDDTQLQWRQSIGDYIAGISNADQTDEDNDIIGQGSLA